MLEMMLKSMGINLNEIIPQVEEGRKLAMDKLREFEARLGDLEASALTANAKLDRILEIIQPKDI